MAIFDILKKELFIEQDEALMGDEGGDEEGGNVNGDAEALVTAMIQNAPGQKEQIGIILKYAANSIPNYDIWDAALDFYESEADNISDDGIGDDEIDEPIDNEPADEPADEPISDEEPVDDSEEEVSDGEPLDLDNY